MTKTSRARVANAIFLAVAFSVLVFAMYPGQFDGDAIGQYHQGINYLFDNSHSVMNAALLGILSNISGGPGPMFILQLALWIFGLFIFTDTLIIAERKIIGQFVSILSVTPFLSFDFFDIQKDALFSGLLAIIVGYAAKIFLMPAKVTIIGLFATFCIFVFALDVRQNAIFVYYSTLVFSATYLLFQATCNRDLRWNSVARVCVRRGDHQLGGQSRTPH